MAGSWAVVRWTKMLTKSASSLHKFTASTGLLHPSRPSVLSRLYTVVSRPVDVMSPMSKPLQVTGVNSSVYQQHTVRPLLPCNSAAVFNNAQPCRGKKRGMEYQPSTRKRKNKLGLHARLKTRGGIKLIMRRMLKGRYLLTH